MLTTVGEPTGRRARNGAPHGTSAWGTEVKFPSHDGWAGSALDSSLLSRARRKGPPSIYRSWMLAGLVSPVPTIHPPAGIDPPHTTTNLGASVPAGRDHTHARPPPITPAYTRTPLDTRGRDKPGEVQASRGRGAGGQANNKRSTAWQRRAQAQRSTYATAHESYAKHKPTASHTAQATKTAKATTSTADANSTTKYQSSRSPQKQTTSLNIDTAEQTTSTTCA